MSTPKRQHMHHTPAKNIFSERLRILAFEKNIYQADVVAALKKDRGTVSKWWNGEIVPGPKNMRLIAGFFGCDVNWLANGTGEPFPKKAGDFNMSQSVSKSTGVNQIQIKDVHGDFHQGTNRGASGNRRSEARIAEMRNIPVLSKILDDIRLSVEENTETYVSLPEAPLDCFALKVADDAMAPIITRGDYVIFVIDRPPKPGDIVVVNDDFGDSMVRRLKAKDDERHLVADNPVYPSYQANESYRIMGVAVESIKRTKL